jgi:hypothetical protein
MVGGRGVEGDLAKPVLAPATGRRRRSCQHRLVPAASSPGPPVSNLGFSQPMPTTIAQQYPNEKLAAALLDVTRAAAAADEVDGSVKR